MVHVILIMLTIDQGIILTAQLERPVDEELSADRETGVDETAEHRLPQDHFLSSARNRWPAHRSLFSRGHQCDVMNSSFSVTLAGRRFDRDIGCQDARVVIFFAVDAAGRGASDYASEVRYAQDVGNRMRTSR
jgi:hypothetical protein